MYQPASHLTKLLLTSSQVKEAIEKIGFDNPDNETLGAARTMARSKIWEEEIKLALGYLRGLDLLNEETRTAEKYGKMADCLEAMIKDGLVKAGTFEGFLAAAYTLADGRQSIVLTNDHPVHNDFFERTASLIQVITANEATGKAFLGFYAKIQNEIIKRIHKREFNEAEAKKAKNNEKKAGNLKYLGRSSNLLFKKAGPWVLTVSTIFLKLKGKDFTLNTSVKYLIAHLRALKDAIKAANQVSQRGKYRKVIEIKEANTPEEFEVTNEKSTEEFASTIFRNILNSMGVDVPQGSSAKDMQKILKEEDFANKNTKAKLVIVGGPQGGGKVPVMSRFYALYGELTTALFYSIQAILNMGKRWANSIISVIMVHLID